MESHEWMAWRRHLYSDFYYNKGGAQIQSGESGRDRNPGLSAIPVAASEEMSSLLSVGISSLDSAILSPCKQKGVT
ncbi:hypothetical protein Q9966_013747 [Columba livia]|nr:hypothetical protein Q9966_013747 [Columba livia]